jgi:hypothetical protein
MQSAALMERRYMLRSGRRDADRDPRDAGATREGIGATCLRPEASARLLKLRAGAEEQGLSAQRAAAVVDLRANVAYIQRTNHANAHPGHFRVLP